MTTNGLVHLAASAYKLIARFLALFFQWCTIGNVVADLVSVTALESRPFGAAFALRLFFIGHTWNTAVLYVHIPF